MKTWLNVEMHLLLDVLFGFWLGFVTREMFSGWLVVRNGIFCGFFFLVVLVIGALSIAVMRN